MDELAVLDLGRILERRGTLREIGRRAEWRHHVAQQRARHHFRIEVLAVANPQVDVMPYKVDRIILHPDLAAHFRLRGQEIRQPAIQPMHRHRGQGADHEAGAHFALEQAAGHFGQALDHLRAVGIDGETGIGQLQLVVAADEELLVEELFQQFHLLADRAWRDTELPRGLAEPAEPCTGLESLYGIERRKFRSQATSQAFSDRKTQCIEVSLPYTQRKARPKLIASDRLPTRSGTAMNDTALKDLGETLARYSDLPYERAWSMPRGFYTDPKILAVEAETLFLNEWVCVGREEEVAKPGDYFVFKIWNESVVVIRGRDAKLRAFSNVCRHRGALIARGSGNRNVLLCPYHHWSYDTLGRLAATPGIDPREDFDRANCRLPEFHCEAWHGFIFVSLADNPPALAPQLAGLEPLIAPYHMDEMKLHYLVDEIWPVNWKCLVENSWRAITSRRCTRRHCTRSIPAGSAATSRPARPISATMPASSPACRARRAATPISPMPKPPIASWPPCRRAW